MVTQEYVYAYAAVSVATGDFDALILPHVNSTCMQVFLDEVAARYPKETLNNSMIQRQFPSSWLIFEIIAVF